MSYAEDADAAAPVVARPGRPGSCGTVMLPTRAPGDVEDGVGGGEVLLDACDPPRISESTHTYAKLIA